MAKTATKIEGKRTPIKDPGRKEIILGESFTISTVATLTRAIVGLMSETNIEGVRTNLKSSLWGM
jgi:adenosine/AMP kinase